MPDNLEINGIIKDTEKNLTTNPCENIMKEKVWKKNCPKCKCDQIYSCKSVLISSIKKDTECNKCRGISLRKYNDVFERYCSCGNLMKYNSYRVYKRSIKESWECRKCATKKSAIYKDKSFFETNEYKIKMSNSVKNSEKNKNKFTEEFREKLRLAKLNQIKKLGTQYNYNPNACKFIEDFGNKMGYNFQHAMNGGEVIISGYSLDGYDKDHNIVFEYDEPKHSSLGVKKNDKIREQRIIQKINPKMFIRYNEQKKTLIDVISGKEIL